jgi:hypothetical protein
VAVIARRMKNSVKRKMNTSLKTVAQNLPLGVPFSIA